MADDGRLAFSVEIEGKSAEETLDILKKKIKDMADELVNAGDDIDDVIAKISNDIEDITKAGYGEEATAELNKLKGAFGGNAEATKRVTALINGFKVAMKAGADSASIMKTALAGLKKGLLGLVASGGLTLLISLITALVSKIAGLIKQRLDKWLVGVKERMAEAAVKAEKLRKEFEDWSNQVAKSASQPIVTFKRLQKQWNSLGDSIASKKKFLVDFKKEMDSLGVAVKNVSDAENLFVAHSQEFIQALKNKAVAAAYYALAAEKTNELIKKQLERESEEARLGVMTLEDGTKLQRGFYKGTDIVEIDVENNPTIQKLRKEASDLEKEINRLLERGVDNESQYFTALAANNIKAAGNALDEQRKKLEKAFAESLAAYQRNKEKIASQVQFDTQQVEIDAMKEGLDKTLRQLELNHNKELAKITQQENERIEAWRKLKEKEWKAKNPTEDDDKNPFGVNNFKIEALSESDKTKLKDEIADYLTLRSNENDKYRLKQESAYKTYYEQMIADYGTYEQRRKEITRQTEEAIEKLYQHDEKGKRKTDENGNLVFQEGLSQANVDEVTRQATQAYSDLAQNMASDNPKFQRFIERLQKLTISEIKNLKKLLEAELEVAKENGDAQKMQELQLSLDTVDGLLLQLSADANSTADDIDKWCERVATAGEQISDIGSNIDSVTGQAIAASGKLIAQTAKGIQSLQNLLTESFEAMKEATGAVQKAAIAVQSSVAILAIISAIWSALNELKNSLQGTNFEGSYLDGLLEMLTDLEHLLRNSLAILSVFGTDWVVKDYVLKKEAEKNTHTALLRMKRDYEEFGKTIDELHAKQEEAFGDTKAQLLEEERLMKERRKEYLKAAMTTAFATGQLALFKELSDEYRELEEDATDYEKATFEAINGQSINDAIQSFGDALAGAWEQGTDAAQAAQDAIKDMIKKRIREELLAELAKEKALVDIYDKIDAAKEDGVITNSELAAILAAGEEVADELTEKYKEQFRMLQSEADRSASATGIAQISQETADEISGRMTAIQGHTFSISENTALLQQNVAAMLGSVRQIERYAGSVDNNLSSFISYLKNNGIKLQQSAI